MAIAALVATFPAGASAAGTLQPGQYHETDTGACTMNFVYDGAGGPYLGTAAHCVAGVGDVVRDMDGDRFGAVAYIGNENSTVDDWALIRVDADDVARLNAGVKGSPQYPKGVTAPSETGIGDPVQLSGYGLGFGTNPATQERRVAAMGYDDNELYDVTGPLIFGDSGGPLVHIPSGKALGIVSRLCVGVCTEEGPTVQGIIAKAAAKGATVTLRTP
jgi:hypothetical protein